MYINYIFNDMRKYERKVLNMKYGFIGVGNMSSAIIRGMCAGDKFNNEDILGYNRTAAKVEKLSAEYGVTTCYSTQELVEKSDVIVLGVKPQMLPSVLPEVKKYMKDGQLIVSIAAGKEISYLKEELGENVHVIRVMPNVNSRVLSSTSCYTASEDSTEEEIKTVEEMFGAVGSIIKLTEDQFGIFSAVGGASPAFTYMYIDALARGGVKAGMPKDLALKIAADSVMGSAKMVLESGKHPYALVDEVCSPGGTTIEGVCTLHEKAFMDAAEKAVTAVIEKDNRLK